MFTIGNLLEVTKYITGLKHSQLPTGTLQNTVNAVLQEPQKVCDWLTTGINYWLLKSEDSKEVRNY